MKKQRVDYSGFSLRRLREPRFSHMLLLLGWVGYFALYFITENLIPVERCHEIHCVLDDMIPFREGFVIIYVAWYAVCFGSLAYTLFFDVPNFKRLQIYIMITQALAMLCYIVYPSIQLLRPAEFPRQNFFTWMVSIVYGSDEPTNVFPSEHVIAALGMVFATLHSKKLRRPAFSIPFITLQLLICVSVVFVKQHSILDVAGGAALSLPGYFLFFFPWKKRLPWNDPETAER